MANTTGTQTPLTAELFDQFAERDEFLGFGYIGGRRHMSPEVRAIADARAIEEARINGLTVEALFEWANSKAGRWYADCENDRHASKYLPR